LLPELKEKTLTKLERYKLDIKSTKEQELASFEAFELPLYNF